MLNLWADLKAWLYRRTAEADPSIAQWREEREAAVRSAEASARRRVTLADLLADSPPPWMRDRDGGEGRE